MVYRENQLVKLATFSDVTCRLIGVSPKVQIVGQGMGHGEVILFILSFCA